MIEVKSSAARSREMRAIAIKVIQRKSGGFSSQNSLKLFSEPGFARPAAADDCD
jgi:hypothetical protein